MSMVHRDFQSRLLACCLCYGPTTQNLYNKRFENMSIFRFGVHPYKLATLRATVALIITSCYSIKLIKIKGFITPQ